MYVYTNHSIIVMWPLHPLFFILALPSPPFPRKTGAPLISTPLPLDHKDRTGSSTSLSSSGSGVQFLAMNGGSASTVSSSAHTSLLSDTSERSETQSTITGSTMAGKGHQRSKSTIMYDKLLDHEIKDLLICLMYIVKNVNEGMSVTLMMSYIYLDSALYWTVVGKRSSVVNEGLNWIFI